MLVIKLLVVRAVLWDDPEQLWVDNRALPDCDEVLEIVKEES